MTANWLITRAGIASGQRVDVTKKQPAGEIRRQERKPVRINKKRNTR